jgi:hypothetical protein
MDPQLENFNLDSFSAPSSFFVSTIDPRTGNINGDGIGLFIGVSSIRKQISLVP